MGQSLWAVSGNVGISFLVICAISHLNLENWGVVFVIDVGYIIHVLIYIGHGHLQALQINVWKATIMNGNTCR